jgi:hypothetical protein
MQITFIDVTAVMQLRIVVIAGVVQQQILVLLLFLFKQVGQAGRQVAALLLKQGQV